MDANLVPKTELSDGWEQGSAHSSSEGSLPGSAPRRRSTRELKRTKFDDEIVSSAAVAKSPRKAAKPGEETPAPTCGPTLLVAAPPPKPSPTGHNTRSSTNSASVSPVVKEEEPTPPKPPPVPQSAGKGGAGRKKPAKGGKGSGKPSAPSSTCPSPSHPIALEDLGRWTPTDDLALITAVMQTNDLEKVQTGIKFSCKFTLEEVQERWYALLYDNHISRVAVDGMRELPLDTVIRVQSNTLFKKQEEQVLATIPSSTAPAPGLDTFGLLLEKNPDVFHHARTPRSLLTHWEHLAQFRLLPDQNPLPWPAPGEGSELTFSELEDNLAAEGDEEALDPVAEAETEAAERLLHRDLRQDEAELSKWTVLVESVTGISPPDFDPRTMAVLRGRLVRFLVRSKEITIGRSTRDKAHCVDVDLSFEGPAQRISRRQATIKLRSTGEFLLCNEGKRPMYVDGRPLLTLAKTKLDNNAVIEVANIRLVFFINLELMSSIRSEATKMLIA